MANEKLNARIKLFDDTIKFKPTKKIPTFMQGGYWKYLQMGYNLNQVLYDYDLMLKLCDKFDEDFQFDAYMDGIRNPFKVSAVLGVQKHMLDPS